MIGKNQSNTLIMVKFRLSVTQILFKYVFNLIHFPDYFIKIEIMKFNDIKFL